jgi:hypothetical protein
MKEHSVLPSKTAGVVWVSSEEDERQESAKQR